MTERYRDFSIELDCPPGSTRPGDLIGSVLKGTRLKESDFNTSPPLFGEQVWVLKPGNPRKDATFKRHKLATLKPRIEALFHAGFIRWGSW